tara:strand:+ start:2443 stop:2778 length:336 start_codon:yes stop_codon:yes gene_type:complete
MTIFAISIAIIICIGLPVAEAIIANKQLSRREADYQLLRKHYTEKFFRLEELEELHDSMTRARDLWEDKYRKLKVDYKILKAEKVRAELEAIKEVCTPIYEDIAEWESKKL